MSRGPTVKQLQNYCRPRRCPKCLAKVRIWPCVACTSRGPRRAMPAGSDARFQIPIQELSLGSNVRDRLEQRGFLLVGHLLMARPMELVSTPGLGMTVLSQVREALLEIGFGSQGVQRAG